jgi:acyl-[acyl-carrier-protein]-phospholipid O-acyltransferase/long-chain-fatty-acid--[acyl-carrier-protein] ligase
MQESLRRIERRAKRSIFHALLEAARNKGLSAVAVIDGDGRELTYRDIIRASFALGGPIARATESGEKIGVMMPTGAGAVIALMAAFSQGRTPAMFNFTSGARNLKAAAKAAEVKKVITAHKFIEIAKLEDLVEELSDTLEFLYLEDMKEALSPLDKARAIAGPLAPRLFSANPDPESLGIILFTSGTEGDPKGVALSHANILSNIYQIAEHVEILPTDIFFNPLPTFHCYGLTAGTLWPILNGYPVALHPSPLQTKIIPKRIFETGATVLFATDTFLQQYMRASDDGGMSSLRIAVCGAERVKDETRQVAERRFSFEVLEGYGVTEASPVLAANQPGDIRSGTVGKLLPGVETKLEPVEGLPGSVRLYVRGPNIMQGYITPDAPGVIKPLDAGWHDTGDVVSFDEHGYMTIRGRMKRFAKIGGEMVSLAVVENCAAAVWPEHMHAAAAIADDRKGEQIVLVTDHPAPDRAHLLAWAQNHGVPEIAVPKKIVAVKEVPILGTGKLDYVSINRLAADGVAGDDVQKRAREDRLAEIDARLSARKNESAPPQNWRPAQSGA